MQNKNVFAQRLLFHNINSYADINTTENEYIKIHGNAQGESSLMIFGSSAQMKYKYGNRHFRARAYYVDTAGRNKAAIAKYIQNQQEEDKIMDQMSLKEYIDPLRVSRQKEANKIAATR